MRVLSEKQTLGLLVLAVALNAPAAWAVVPVTQPPLVVSPVAINVSAGDQTDPHVSGDWAVYTDNVSIRYYRFSTFTDAGIPMGTSARDTLSDVSGSRIVFSRTIIGVKTTIMVFDAAAAGPAVEIDPAPTPIRLGSAIGGNTVAYVDLGLHANGELVIHDLATSTSVRITTDTAFDTNPSVSPSGTVVTWEHCPISMGNCDIWQAVKNAGTWTASAVQSSSDPEGNPDTNGTLLVYDSHRAGISDIFWRPSAGGAEVQLQWPGLERNPSFAGDFIAFESQAAPLASTDMFVYDTVNNRLFQITDTPLINEQLNDVAMLPDGSLRLVWAGDEDGFDNRNIWSATFRLPNLAPTLTHSTEAGYGTDGVSPDSGTTATSFTYKVVYTDADDDAPSYVDACIDGPCLAMAVDAAAAAALRDGDFRNGEQYAYATTLAAGSHTYHFEASDGADTARLPAAGALTGPSVTGGTPRITIDDVLLTEGDSGFKNAIFTVSLSEPSAQPVKVWYITWLGTALPLLDFVPALDRLTIPAGQLQGAVTVRVRGETVVEGDETFYVVLFAPHGAAIDDGVGQGTIVNDDP